MNRVKTFYINSKFIITIIVSLVICTLLSGCIPRSIIDELGITHTIGIDEENGKLTATVLYPNYTNNNKASVIKTAADNPSTLKSNLGHKSQSQIVLGQIRTFVFGDSYSKAGISRVLETICKDATIGNITFVVSDLKAEDIIKGLKTAPPLYLSHLLETSVLHEGTPETNIHTLINQYYGSGIDIYLPNISFDNEKQLIINGLSIFKGDKLKLTISNKEAFLFKLMNDKNISGYYDITLPIKNKQKGKENDKQQKQNNDKKQGDDSEKRPGNENNFALKSLYGKHKITLHKKGNENIINMNLTLNVELKGIPESINIEKKEDYHYLKKSMEQIIAKDIETLLKKLQQNEVDPFGFGIIYRSENKEWNEKEFYKTIYPKMKFSVKTDLILRQLGVGE
ncbi:Ger(x)C family spore germination protein [Gottfriedia solisilvae]|uniref:Ger(x)C family spore germination protein n=1 Tax=Gottfriedia solisilvae TaxID=1516104 RepID=UPI003D2EBB4E